MSRLVGYRGCGQHGWRWVLLDEYRKLPPRVRWFGLASLVAAVVAIAFGLGFALHSVRDTSAAPLAGAIFTTTPDGAIVNENVHYDRKIEVYLDGGPGPNAPQTAAGLPDGDYVFQVTDPPGKVLLSQDASRCRVIRVADGVIVSLRDKTNGSFVDHTASDACHVNDGPEGAAGATGKHDTNVDADHGPPAIVVQLMPFFDTPNPGGVYKAWVMPLSRYQANGGNLDAAPVSQCIRNGKPANNCNGGAVQIGYRRDPGFGPPRDQVKTDNFKVKEFFPPEISVRKFDDLNGDGVWQKGIEPEIGVDEFIDGGGWPYDFTEPVDGGNVTNPFYTPHTHVAGIPGTYTACERRLSGWTQTAAYLDGALHNADQCVSVNVAGISGEKHEIVFGNFKNVSVEACKFDDKTGDGLTPDDTPIAGWTVNLTKNGIVQDTEPTGPDGCYTWTDLGPVPGGYYDVSEVVPPGWTPTSVTSHDFDSPPLSGASYSFTFTNFENVNVTACKLEDADGDLATTNDQTPIPGWTVYLSIDGVRQLPGRPTGADGCYTWADLGPGHSYDVEEDVPAGWTPLTPTSVDFGPAVSGMSYSFTFKNFENVSVTACKLKDTDGDLATTDDQTPIAGWTVKLTKNGVVQDTQHTGADGCYTWTNLGPVPGGYYDVGEVVPAGWMPLTPTWYNFGSPPQSGASYSFTFVNTPTQGCTPGYWKVEQHWDSWPAPWSPGGPLSAMFSGVNNSPYATSVVTFPDGTSVLMGGATQGQALNFQGGDSVPEKAEILLRAAVAAVLNADSPGVNFPWTSAQVASAVNAALASQDATTIIDLADQLDGDNNGPGGCPLN
jgi:hypothetical protein